MTPERMAELAKLALDATWPDGTFLNDSQYNAMTEARKACVAAIPELLAEVMRLRSESDHRRRAYLDVADALMPESSSPDRAAAEARTLSDDFVSSEDEATFASSEYGVMRDALWAVRP